MDNHEAVLLTLPMLHLPFNKYLLYRHPFKLCLEIKKTTSAVHVAIKVLYVWAIHSPPSELRLAKGQQHTMTPCSTNVT